MKFLDKLNEKPLSFRKAISWGIIAIVGGGLIFLWLRSIPQRIENANSFEFIETLKNTANSQNEE